MKRQGIAQVGFEKGFKSKLRANTLPGFSWHSGTLMLNTLKCKKVIYFLVKKFNNANNGILL